MIVLVLLLLQEPPPTVTFQRVKETRRGIIDGHVKSIPKAMEAFVDQWVTMSGFPVISQDGQWIRIAENQYDAERQYGTPPDVFNSVSVVYRKPPEKLRDAKYLQVSGYLRFRKIGSREGNRENLVKLWHLTEAVEGAVPNPDATSTAPPKEGTLSFSLLESATTQGGDINIPDPVRALDGKWVTLTGHVLLNWTGEDITSFQVAKNPWDGCCMGVPPNFFNSVRVAMAPGQKLSSRFDRVATVSGRFKVDVRKTANGYVDGVYWLEQAVEGAAPSPDAPAAEPKQGFPTWAFVGVLAVAGAFFLLRRKT
jgi:hypothetical protein